MFNQSRLVLGESDRKDVRVQETREEADKKAKRRSDGPHREADITEDQFEIRRKSCLRVRNERRPVFGIDDNEWRRFEVPHLQYGRRAGPGYCEGTILRRRGRVRARPFASAGLY